jgi:hypothetical protein
LFNIPLRKTGVVASHHATVGASGLRLLGTLNHRLQKLPESLAGPIPLCRPRMAFEQHFLKNVMT